MSRTLLANSYVKDAYELIERNALTVTKDASIETLLRLLVKDTRTRHVYVVDEEGTLIGSVRLNSILTYFTPSLLLDAREGLGDFTNYFKFAEAESIFEIMDEDSSYVTEETLLKDALTLMGKAQINEIPVLDEKKKVIGELNLVEVAKHYLDLFDQKEL